MPKNFILNWFDEKILRGSELCTLFPQSHCVLWKNEKFTLTEIFFRQINSLVIYLVNALFSRNFCQNTVRMNFRNFHTVHSVEKCYKTPSRSKKSRQINTLSISLVKTLIWRKKCCVFRRIRDLAKCFLNER